MKQKIILIIISILYLKITASVFRSLDSTTQLCVALSLLSLLAIYEILLCKVFFYQRTVRTIAFKIEVPQPFLNFLYPSWMLLIYGVGLLRFPIWFSIFYISWKIAICYILFYALIFIFQTFIPINDRKHLVKMKKRIQDGCDDLTKEGRIDFLNMLDEWIAYCENKPTKH